MKAMIKLTLEADFNTKLVTGITKAVADYHGNSSIAKELKANILLPHITEVRRLVHQAFRLGMKAGSNEVASLEQENKNENSN